MPPKMFDEERRYYILSSLNIFWTMQNLSGLSAVPVIYYSILKNGYTT